MYFADIASSLYFVLGNCAGWGARSIMPENIEEANAENDLLPPVAGQLVGSA
jgi:hypothetical protein